MENFLYLELAQIAEEAISLTNHAEKIGANGALVVTPYYNKPTRRFIPTL